MYVCMYISIYIYLPGRCGGQLELCLGEGGGEVGVVRGEEARAHLSKFVQRQI